MVQSLGSYWSSPILHWSLWIQGTNFYDGNFAKRVYNSISWYQFNWIFLYKAISVLDNLHFRIIRFLHRIWYIQLYIIIFQFWMAFINHIITFLFFFPPLEISNTCSCQLVLTVCIIQYVAETLLVDIMLTL